MWDAGASVIYADTVADLGYADELGNYAEYSGAPNLQVCLPTPLCTQFHCSVDIHYSNGQYSSTPDIRSNML